MIQRLTYAVRILLLVLYTAYALSPVYLSVTAGCADRRHEHAPQPQHLTVGIVWVNVLLAPLFDDPADDALIAGGEAVSQTDSALILIRKKRAVLREQQVVSPPIAASYALPHTSTEPGHSASRLPEVRPDLKHRESDGYSSLHAGLSPPLHLS